MLTLNYVAFNVRNQHFILYRLKGRNAYNLFVISTAAKGYDCAFCDKSTKIGSLVVLYI